LFDDLAADPIGQLAKQRAIKSELATKGLDRMLVDAQGYIQGGAPTGSEQAVGLYEQVMAQLSPDVVKALHQPTLEAARADEKAGRLDEAALRFQDLFADFFAEPIAAESGRGTVEQRIR
jgi:hypothetical protein